MEEKQHSPCRGSDCIFEACASHWQRVLAQRLNVIKFKTIYADPPWAEQGGGKTKRGADRHYNLMKTKDIVALPVSDLADDNAHLYLWVTNNFLEDGLKVMKAWGFKYITNIVWIKQGPVGLGQYFRGAHELLLFGVRGMVPYKLDASGKRCQGKTFYSEPDFEGAVLQLAQELFKITSLPHGTEPDSLIDEVTCGEGCELMARRILTGVMPDSLMAPRTTHSTKPPIFRQVVEHVSTGPFLELFARQRHENWSAWGNQVPGGNDVDLVDGTWITRERSP